MNELSSAADVADQLRTAVHESAHAVIGYRQGFTVRELEIGQLTLDGTPCRGLATMVEPTRPCIARVKAILAGPLAELLICRVPFTRQHHDQRDYFVAREVLFMFCGEDQQRYDEVFDLVIRDLKQEVPKQEMPIRELAADLLYCKRLDERFLTKFFQQRVLP